jgi:hypothetical protein
VRRWSAIVVVACLALAGGVTPSAPADMGVAAPALPETVDARVVTRDYLDRRAVLLMIRATFDVIGTDEIPAILAADVEAVGADGPSEVEMAILDRDLLAEASYYLVSLKYLISFGGAAWPGDRPEASYVNDALLRLDGLQDALVAVAAERADPLPLLLAAEEIRGWTEGFESLPEALRRFADRDHLVETAIAEHGPWTTS